MPIRPTLPICIKTGRPNNEAADPPDLLLALHAQETSLGQAVGAYTDLYTRYCIRQHKHLDADVVAKVLASLKSHFSEYPEAYKKSGEFYAELGDFDQAIHEYQEGMAADGAHKIDYQKRTIELLIRQKNDQAAAMNHEILREHPQDPEARGLDASFLLDKGDADAAIAELQLVVEQMPGNFVARFNLGRAYFSKGKWTMLASSSRRPSESSRITCPPGWP